MSDETKNGPRQLTMPVATVAALVIAIVTGLTSGGVASSSSAQQQREGQIRLEAGMQQLRDELRRIGDDTRAGFARNDARFDGHDARLRAVELHQARDGAPSPR